MMETMRLPEGLREAIAKEVRASDAAAVARAAGELSQAYREGSFKTPPLATPAHRIAYLGARLPATFAACMAALMRLRETWPQFAPQSLLDLGAGPGTATWAAVEVFPSLKAATLLERDRQMIDIGKRLAAASPHDALRRAAWETRSIDRSVSEVSYDLVIASYVLCELEPTAAKALRLAWQTSGQVLVVVEPGTPAAFARLAEVRQTLIQGGAPIAAPCPHEETCPLLRAGDWCHFSARLQRDADHRRLKGGSLGYEDEKFSYLCATRASVDRPEARIVRHPMKYPGHVKLELCTAAGIRQETVTRSQKERYRSGRKAVWGDGWPPR